MTRDVICLGRPSGCRLAMDLLIGNSSQLRREWKM